MEDTKTSAMLVIKDDIIRYEKYFFGGNEDTFFSSNSMGKSFVSALMGIAISEGYVGSVEELIGKYIPEFVGTELENIPIRACLQMASGINFNEEKDMSGFSMRTLMGRAGRGSGRVHGDWRLWTVGLCEPFQAGDYREDQRGSWFHVERI